MLADKLIVGRCGIGDATRLNICGGEMRGRASQKLKKNCRAFVCLLVPVSVLTVNNLFWVPEEADDYPLETNPNICEAGWGS